VVARGRAQGPAFQPFGGTGDARLPSLVGNAPLTAPAPSPLTAPAPGETFAPTLPFEDQVLREPVAAPPPSPDTAVATVREAAQRPELVNSIAAALVLLLVGAHVRRWATSTPRP
jgi:hypothetical protein